MRMKTMNKIKRYILTFLTLLATTATWGGDIIIPTSYNHGTITASLENTTGVVTTANEGEAVLLNVSPDPGYILSSDNLRIVIYAKADNADTRTQIDTKDIVSFTTVDVNTYRFIMPKYDVEIEATFTDATDVESAVVTLKEGTTDLSGYSHVYDWADHTPEISSVVLGGVTLVKNTDYEVSTTSTVAAVNGVYSIQNVSESITFRITGKGQYKGTKDVVYNITPHDIENATITLASTSLTYNQAAQTPEVTVSITENSVFHPLTITTEFTVTYPTDATNAGTKTVNVSGTGNFTGSRNVTYTINRKALTTDMVSISPTSYVYDGTAKEPAVTVTDNGNEVDLSNFTIVYSNNINVGTTANVRVTGNETGNYSGYVDKTFTITASEIDIEGDNTFTVELATSGQTFTYNGSAQTPAIVVKSGSTVLTKETHYTVTYSNNINAGTATITVQGTGNYRGTKTLNFTINPKTLAPEMVVLSDIPTTYNQQLQKPTVTISDGTALTTNDYTLTNDGGTNQGTYEVRVDGKVNYTGTVTKTFTIAPLSLSSAVVTLSQTEYVYSGSANTPSVTSVMVGSLTVPTTGYGVTYSSNINQGTSATVTVTGTGNYKDSKSVNFTITRKSVNDTMIKFASDQENYVYNGSNQKPTVTVMDGETELVLNTDYTITNDGGTEVGTYNVDIVGKGNYQGTARRQFSIVAKDANTKFTVELGYATTIFDGSNKTPTVTVKEGSTTLAVNTDYTVSFSNNRNVGTATVTVTGKGHYAGTKTATFAITKKALADDMLTLSSTSFTFNGTNQKPVATITDGGIIAESDYTLTNAGGVNAGTYHVVVAATSAGNYSGSIDKTFTIGQLDIASATLTLNTLDSYVYDGLVKEPGVKEIKFSDGLIVSADGYSVAYSNNLNIGEATVTVTGKVNYTGTKTASFTITPQPITEEMILLSNEQYVYNGNLQKPDVIVMSGATTLTQDVDYTLENDGGTAVGVYQVKVTGKGNYIDTATKRYRIVDQIAYSFDVEMSTESVVYNGTAQEPKVVVKDGKKTLEVGTHYTLVYTNNVNVGTASVIITGQGDYTGTKTMSFLIKPKALTEEMVSLDKTEFVYNAMTQRPAVTVKDGDALTANDYVLTNSGGTDVGTYDVIVTGRNNYSGSIKRQFKITPLSIDTATVVLYELPNYVYDGTAKSPGVREVIIGSLVVPPVYYTSSISDNVNAGTVTVTATATGNYIGTAKTTFKILPKHLTEDMVVVLESVIKYTGSAQKPPVRVTDGDKVLSERRDYQLLGNGGVEVGDYEVIIGGIGNYTDSITRSYSIQYDGIPIDIPVIDDDDKESEAEFIFVPTTPNSSDVKVAGVSLPEDKQSGTFGVTIPVTCLKDDKTYHVVGIADGAFKGMKNLRDVWLPDTDEPLAIGEEAIPSTSTVHVSLAMLDDYALMPSLEDNFISGNVMATVPIVNRYWTFGSGVDVRVPEGMKTFIVTEQGNDAVAIKELTDEQLMIGGQRIVKSNNGVLFACMSNDTVCNLVASAKRMRSGETISYDDHKDYGAENRLVPVVRSTHFESGYYYFLKNNEFCRIKNESAEVKVPAGKAVLYLGPAASTRGFASVLGITDDGTTDLSPHISVEADEPWYDMTGRQLPGKPTQKGVYIHNRQKVVIR